MPDSQSEKQQKQSISLLNAVIESTADGILVVDSEGKIVTYNQKFVKMWRIPESLINSRDDEQLVGFVLSQLKDPQAFISKIRELYDQDQAESNDTLEFKDGRIYERYSMPQFLQGRSVGRVWSFRDVTDHARAIRELEEIRQGLVQKLRGAQAFVNSIIDNIPDLIFVKDAKELRYVRINRAGERILGYSQDELTGKSDFELFPKDQAEAFTAMDRAVMSCRRMIDIPEETVRTKSRQELIVHTKKIPILDKNGVPEFLLGISEDITERKRAELHRQQLQEEQVARASLEGALRLRDEFISIASHELKTPLTTLATQIQLLNQLVTLGTLEQYPKEKLLRLMRLSRQQLNRFTTLINDLLDTSRISSGKLTVSPKKCDLSQLINNVLERFQEQLEAAGCSVEVDVAGPITGEWDPSRVEQVIVNLVTNAMKYGAGRPILIHAEDRGPKVLLQVKDQGIGIAPEDQKRIFRRFERVESTQANVGLGLGLYITSQIIEAHHGAIHVESAPGKGSTFVVELPKAA